MHATLLIILILVGAQPSCVVPVGGERHPMDGVVDVQHYDIHLDLTDGSRLSGTTAIDFVALKSVSWLDVDLIGLIVDSCTLDGRNVSFTRQNGILRIFLSYPMAPGAGHRLVISYEGRPSDGLIIGKNKYGHFSAFSDNWADRARHWFPCMDHPADKATVSFQVSVPAHLEVVANGRLVEKRFSGRVAVYIYSSDHPIPTYCMVVGVADFSIHTFVMATGVPIEYYAFPQDSLGAVIGLRRSADMVAFFDSLIGDYPYSKLALVQSSTQFGGMENSSAIFFPEDSPLFTGGDGEVTLAHEIAHQWFGDAVTQRRWSDLWLSEGFATYFSFVFFEFREGKTRFAELVARARNQYEQRSSKNRPVIDSMYSEPAELLNAENYQKGALFLHALRKEMGDDRWFNGIRRYYSEFKHGNASTNDFRRVMSESAAKPLDRLFEDWLMRPGLPE